MIEDQQKQSDTKRLELENREINITKFINARSEEIHYFRNLLENKSKLTNKTPAQLQPRHMRRRAMSHNRYRIPSRIRGYVNEKMDEFGEKKILRCRKHLRRSRLLFWHYFKRSNDCISKNGQIQEYNDGGFMANPGKAKWLESHIFHAKRFFMKSLFGYKLADTCYTKQMRSSYRFSKERAQLYDQSYNMVYVLKSGEAGCIRNFLEFLVLQPEALEDFFDRDSYKGGVRVKQIDCHLNFDKYDFLGREFIDRKYDQIGNIMIFWNLFDAQLTMLVHCTLEPIFEKLFTIFKDEEIFGQTRTSLEITNYKDLFNIYEMIGPRSLSVLKNTVMDMTSEDLDNKYLNVVENYNGLDDILGFPKNFLTCLRIKPKDQPENGNKKVMTYPKIYEKDKFHGEKNELSIERKNSFLKNYVYEFDKNESESQRKFWIEAECICEESYQSRFMEVVRGRYTHKKKNKKNPVLGYNQHLAKLEKLKAEEVNKNSKMDEEVLKEALQEPDSKKDENSETKSKSKAIMNQNEIVKKIKEDKQKEFSLCVINISSTQDNLGRQLVLSACGKGDKLFQRQKVKGAKVIGINEYEHVLHQYDHKFFPKDFPNSLSCKAYTEDKIEEALIKYNKLPIRKRINHDKLKNQFPFGVSYDKFANDNNLNHFCYISLEALNGKTIKDNAMIYEPEFEDFLGILTNEEFSTSLNKKFQNEKFVNEETVHKDKENQIVLSKLYYNEELGKSDCKRTNIGFATSGYYSMNKQLTSGQGYISSDSYQRLKKIWNEFLAMLNQKKLRWKINRPLPLSQLKSWDCLGLFRSPGSSYYHFIIIRK